MQSSRRIQRRVAASNYFWRRVDFFHGRNEAVTASRQCLDEAGFVGRIAERFPQAHHGVVQAVIEIHKGIARPQTLAKFITSNYLAGLLEKYRENLKRLFGQLQA